MAFRYDGDTRRILRAAGENARILNPKPGPTGYAEGAPQKTADDSFGEIGFAGEQLGIGFEDGKFARYLQNRPESAGMFMDLFQRNPINIADGLGMPETPLTEEGPAI